MARFCGQVPVTHLASSADVLYIQFHSDNIVQARGFNISFTDYREFPTLTSRVGQVGYATTIKSLTPN